MTLHAQLVVLYGAPAAGKLSIAEAISAKTNWVLFPNQVTIDFVAQFLPSGTPRYFELVASVRLDLIRAILAERRSVVFTFAYSGLDEDTAFLKHLAGAASNVGASAHFVRLRCSDATLLRRVSNPSRHRLGKMTDPQILAQALKHLPHNRVLPDFESIEIDTDHYDPDTAASVIVDHIRSGAFPELRRA
jgi:chloramphenicol 3-O-phosphotransferase